GLSRVAGSQSSPARRNATRGEICVMEAEPVEGEPAVNGIEASENGAPPPRNSRQGPARANVRQIRELPSRAIHPATQAIAAEHQRIDDPAAHACSLGGEPAEIGIDGLENAPHLGRIVGTESSVEGCDEDFADAAKANAQRAFPRVTAAQLRRREGGVQDEQRPPPMRSTRPKL